MTRFFPHALGLLVAALMANTIANAAYPAFDPESQCPVAEPHRSPDGFILKSCTIIYPVPAPIHVVERFLADGRLDASWGSRGRVTIPAGQEMTRSCGTAAPERTILFPAGGRILLYQPSSSRLRALRANGDEDLSYGENGVSVPLCGTEPLISLDQLPDGRVVAMSGNNHFIVQLIRADGNSASEFNNGGRVEYQSLPFSPAVFEPRGGGSRVQAISVQEDGRLQVSYLFNGQESPGDSPRLVVLEQQPGTDGAKVVSNRLLPRRGPVFHILAGPTIRQRGNPNGAVSTYSSPLSMHYLATGEALVFVQGTQPSDSVRTPTLVRFTATGQLDRTYGVDGYARITFVPPVAGCKVQLSTEDAYLQGDGSMVYAATGFYYFPSGRHFVPCGDGYPSASTAVKFQADGRLDPSFPQRQAPAISGAKFTTESPKWTAVEYYSPKLDRYFFTPHPLEADAIDRDVTLRAQGWWRTGKSFGVWNPDSSLPGTASACRFAADPIVPPKSFYDSILDEECNILREQELATPPGQRAWRYDRESFRATPPTNGACPSTLIPIYSLYNQGHERGIDSNFRYVDNLTDFNAMIDRGWVGLAKPQFCARPD